MTFSKLILAFSLIVFLGTGCSNNNYSETEKTNSESSENETNNGSSTNQENSQTEQEGETSFTYSASLNHNWLGGARRVFNYDSENERMELMLPLPEGIDIGVEATLPNHPEVIINVDLVRNALVLSFPLKNYLDVVRNPSGLPSGRPLPGINGGEPPSFGFPLSFKDLNAYGYAAVDSISFFVELNFNTFVSFRTPLMSNNGQQVGMLYVLPEANGLKGGIFLSLSLPDELSVLIANAQ